jgi:hypothetical protein
MSITIPADAVLQLRGALYSELGDVAEELASAVRPPEREASDEWPKLVARFDRTRAVLDVIGWTERDPERDVEIDLDLHRRVIVDALSDALEGERDLMLEEGDAAKEQREHAGQRAKVIEAFAASVGLEVD